jgi:dTMP kinase
MPTVSGFLLGIEGIDAVGKRTQSRLLNSRFKLKNLKIKLLTFPDYTTPIGKEIKAFLASNRNYPPEFRHMLFAANRWEKHEELRSLLDEGNTVIVNRYTESNLVYGKANGLSLKWLANLENGLPKSDLVIVLDAPPAFITSRRPTKKDVYEADLRLQKRVRTTYRELARKFRWVIVNATGNVETVHRRMVKIVSAEIPQLN